MTNWEDSQVALSSTLKMMCDQRPEMRQYVGDLLLLLLRGFEESSKEVKETPVEIARRLHEAVDLRAAEATQSELGQQITCRRGCAHCCKMHVSILPEEADLLLEAGTQKGLLINPDRMLKQIRWVEDSEWLDKPEQDRRCLFLGANDECQVYEDRPLACRKHFVVSEPDLCNIDKHPGTKVGIFYDMELEIILSASMTYFGVDTLPRQLVRAIARKAGYAPGLPEEVPDGNS